MPKKILFHSAVHQFLAAAKSLQLTRTMEDWARFSEALSFTYAGNGEVEVHHAFPTTGALRFSLREACFYQRGDTAEARVAHSALESREGDATCAMNADFFRNLVLITARQAGLTRTQDTATVMDEDRLRSEAEFHNRWATSARSEAVDVRRTNEACTAPEMRFIIEALGDLRGKRLLDVGCGLGEASVYFALQGADVTASDLSPGMLEHTQALAGDHGVTLSTHLSSSESLQLADGTLFDIIYIGNTLHHVDIRRTMQRLVPHLAGDGIFVSWDPLAYNPLINLYRKVAVDVRTEDEHPLTVRDIREIRSFFHESSTRCFWLLTLAVFVLMILQRRNPNRERFWKKVIEEEARWSWLYRPLESVDRKLLDWFPFLGRFCWNIVILGRNPIRP